MYKRPYFDACLFIAWIQDEKNNGIHRGEIVEHLFKMAKKGDFRIFISALIFAEVHKTKNSSKASGDDDNYILDMLENEYFVVIDVDRNIGESANLLCRAHSLNPCDAIHLASAEKANCDYLLTWDENLLRVVHPQIKIKPPEIIGQIPLF